MDNSLIDTLKNAGYETIEGKENVLEAIKMISDGSTGRLCSGYGVFPGGDKCLGCKDCEAREDT